MTNALLGLSFLGSHLRWVWLVLCSSSALISPVLAAVRIVVQKARCLRILNAQGSEGQQEWRLRVCNVHTSTSSRARQPKPRQEEQAPMECGGLDINAVGVSEVSKNLYWY